MAEPYIYDEELDDAVQQFLEQESDFEEDSSETEEEEEEDEDEEEEEEDDVEIIDPVRVSNDAVVWNSEGREKRRRVEKGRGGGDETASFNKGCDKNDGECSQGSQLNNIEGLFCPICMDAWTSDGHHQICCLPCGHIFGFSCISRWLKQSRNTAKCPQCKRKSYLKDIRKLFAPRIAIVDEESQKRIQCLEVKCASFQEKDSNWCKKESEWQKTEAELQWKVKQLTERTTYLEHLLEDLQSRTSSDDRGCQGKVVSGCSFNSKFDSQVSCSSFILQRELQVDGARLFDVDASDNQILLLARKRRMGGTYVLTKISLIPPHEKEDISLPSQTKILKDLHISPFNGNLALFASLGKEISVLSMESNNVILSYNLPAAAWSCSWDRNCSNYMYAGLQNGMLLVFDIRQTARPVESRPGLTTNPIHTIHSLNHNSTLPSGIQTVISASSIGVCQWKLGGTEERPSLVPQHENQGVCISLAYCPSSNDIVASYRPRVETSNEMAVSQISPSPIIRQGVQGSYLHLRRVGSDFQKLGIACATVSEIRLPKSTIIDLEHRTSLFAVGDEVTHGLVLQELPSFTVAQQLKSHKHFICDVKYTSTLSKGLLSCLSEDTLQLFNTKLA